MSNGRTGGKPPDMTTVTERATNSIPSVVMKEGIANRSVMKPFRKPMKPAMTSPSNTAGAKGRPATIDDRHNHRRKRKNGTNG